MEGNLCRTDCSSVLFRVSFMTLAYNLPALRTESVAQLQYISSVNIGRGFKCALLMSSDI